MFVYPFKIVLKTCGTTTLLKAIHPILNLARDECGLTELNNVFYSRKNYFDPSKQLYPHTSFDDECKVLDQVFNGQAYVLGQVLHRTHNTLIRTRTRFLTVWLPLRYVVRRRTAITGTCI